MRSCHYSHPRTFGSCCPQLSNSTCVLAGTSVPPARISAQTCRIAVPTTFQSKRQRASELRLAKLLRCMTFAQGGWDMTLLETRRLEWVMRASFEERSQVACVEPAHTLPASNCFVQDPVVTNSPIVVSGSNHRVHHRRTSYVSHVIFTALVVRMHFWLWHITTLVLVLASASKTLWSICPNIDQIPCLTEWSSIKTTVVSMSYSFR